MRYLFARHQTAVYRWLFRFVGNETVAEDLLSDVFFDVWQQAGRFEGRAAVTTWLLGTRCRSQRVGSASAQDLRYLLMRSGSTLRLTDSRIAANDPVAPVRQRLKVGELGRALD